MLSFLGSLAALLVFALPGFFALDTSGATGEEYAVTPLSSILFILAAVSVAIVSVFFTGALAAGAHERMSGGDPTVTSAISRAFARIPGLVPWAIMNWTVGAIIRALRERAGWVGNLILGRIQKRFGALVAEAAYLHHACLGVFSQQRQPLLER